MIQLPFADRAEAGRLLAAELAMMNLPANVSRCLGAGFLLDWRSRKSSGRL